MLITKVNTASLSLSLFVIVVMLPLISAAVLCTDYVKSYADNSYYFKQYIYIYIYRQGRVKKWNFFGYNNASIFM